MIFELAQRRVLLNAFRNRALVSFLLAAVFSGNLASTTAAEDPIYTVLEVPVAQPAAASINNKSQVAATRVEGGGVMLDLWLPAADYGLEAGVHTYSMPLNLPGLPSPTTGIAVRSFADNGTVYFAHAVTFHDGVFAALSSFVPGRSDLIGFINMSANGIIYAKPWDPLTGSPGQDGKSRYLKTGPGHPREEYLGPPTTFLSQNTWEYFSLGTGNSHGVQIVDGRITNGQGGSSPSARGTWDGAITQLPLPGGGAFIGINDKGQLFSNNGYFYLPSADYGRGSGFHAFTFPPGVELSAISGHGEIFRSWGNEFFSIEHDKTIDINQVLAPGTAATITKILWINDNGVILALGTLNGTPNKLLLVSPPAPQEFSITVPPGRYQPGDIITATIRVQTANVEGITVTMDHPLVVSDDPTILEMVEEIKVAPFVLTVLSPPRVFEVQLRALAYGVAEVYASAITVDSEGVAKELVDAAPVSISPLRMTIRALPLVGGKPIVNLKLDDEGKVTDKDGKAVTPKVEVKIENISQRPVKVTLQGVDPRKRDRSTALGRIEVTGEFPLEPQVLAPGTSFTREFGLKINDDGRFDFFVQATGSVVGWSGGITVSGRGAPLAIGEKYPVELELDFVRTAAIANQNNGAFFMQPGSSLQVLASVRNLTSNNTLQFYGLRAEKRFNAFGAVLTSDQGLAIDPPFPHDHEVDAGSTAVLSGAIQTEAEGAPSGTVVWQGLEDAFLVDDQTRVKTELVADDVLVTTSLGSWMNDDLAVRIIQDHSQPEKPSLDGAEIFAVWSHGALLGIGEWMYDTLDAFGGIGRLAGSVSADPSLLGDAMGSASRAVWEAAELAAVTWNNMSEEEREAFVRSKVAEITRRTYLLASTGRPFDPDDVNQALEYTRTATYSLFGGVSDAYASDDPAQIASMWGRVSGHIGMEIVTSALPTPEFGAYTKAADAALLAKNKSIAPAVTTQELYLRALKAGPVDEAITLRGWGITGTYLTDIQDLLRRFKVKGYCRERSPSAHRLIDELGEAVWKMESMKPKGLNELDDLILDNDFPPIIGKNGQDLGARGITGIYMPPSDDVIKARLVAQNHPQPVIDAVLRHAQHRREEFAEYLPKFEKWSKPVSDEGGIPVALNYKDNGIPNPVGQGPNRQFHYQKLEREGKPTLYIPQVMNADGTAFRYISGDVDWVHFSFLDGSPLDPETAARFYDAMVRYCGLQHPETITWIREGSAVFKAKINQIVDYTRGQKPLLEVSGESTRAVFISEKLTRFSNTTRNHLIFFEGGIRSRARSTLADIENAFHYFQNRFPDRRIVAPFLWLTKGDQITEDTTIGGKDWTFTTSDDALLLRQSADGGTLEQFDGTTWVAFDLEQEPAPLALTPATATAAASAAGDSVIQIENLPTLWAEQLVGHLQDWFAAGQTVIIAPGEATQEIRDVIGLGSLILDRPLTFAHPAGTLVAVVNRADGTFPSTPKHAIANLLGTVGSFESVPTGTRVASPPDVVNPGAFPGWRMFNVDSGKVSFNASIDGNASNGSKALRLDVNNTGGASSYGLDQWGPVMHTSVQLGQRYIVSFDAAWIAGLTTSNLLFQVQEFDTAGSFLGNGLSTLRSVSTTAYQKHTFVYQPVNPATAGIGLFFGPLRGVVGTTTISLDYVRMVVAPLVVNGDFEFSPLTTSAGGPGVFVNTTTFLGWRLFSVGSPPITSLTGTIVDAGGYTGGQSGSRALRLAVTNTGSPSAHDYGLDNANARSPVMTGRKYTLSFDVALVQVSGSLTLNTSVAEFNAAGTFTGTQGGFAPALTADQTFRRYTMAYVVANPATTQVVIAFRPVTTGQSTLVFDNVVFAPFVADPPTNLSLSVNGLSLALTWPGSHLGWRAQSNSVNLANPSAWFDIPGSESVTNLNLAVSPAMPAVFYRLRRP